MKPIYLTCGEDNLSGLYAVFNAVTNLFQHLNNQTGYSPKIDYIPRVEWWRSVADLDPSKFQKFFICGTTMQDLVNIYFPKLIWPFYRSLYDQGFDIRISFGFKPSRDIAAFWDNIQRALPNGGDQQVLLRKVIVAEASDWIIVDEIDSECMKVQCSNGPTIIKKCDVKLETDGENKDWIFPKPVGIMFCLDLVDRSLDSKTGQVTEQRISNCGKYTRDRLKRQNVPR